MKIMVKNFCKVEDITERFLVIVARFEERFSKKNSVRVKRPQKRKQEFRTDNNGNCHVQEENFKNFCEFE